jgi:hypothetical protein
MEEMYTDVSRLTVRQINKKVAESFVRENHYTHKLSSARYTLGLFYTEDNHSFFAGEHEKLIGCIVYGHPVSNATVTSMFKTLPLELPSILELTRLVILDGYGKNIESYFIGQSFRWLKQNDPRVKVLISYADPEQGHTGGIYRATNWYYQGCGAGKLMPDFSIKTLENGQWIHSRTVGSVYGSRNIESLAKKIGHTFWRKEEFPKHRYLYFLCSPREKKKLMQDVKVLILPYNQIRPFTSLVQQIIVKDGVIEEIKVLQGEDIGWKVKRGEYVKEEATTT